MNFSFHEHNFLIGKGRKFTVLATKDQQDRIIRDTLTDILSQNPNGYEANSYPKGICLIRESSSLDKIALKWQLQFPEAIIKTINRETNASQQESINAYAEGDLDCHLLITSPTISTGIRTNGCFDLVIVETTTNPEQPLTSKEIVQCLTRDDDCADLYWRERDGKLQKRYKNNRKFSEEGDEEVISEILGENLEARGLFLKYDQRMRLQLTPLGRRKVRQHNKSIDDRKDRKNNVIEEMQKHGFDVEVLEEDDYRYKQITSNYKEDVKKQLTGVAPILPFVETIRQRLGEIGINRDYQKKPHMVERDLMQLDDFWNKELRRKKFDAKIKKQKELSQEERIVKDLLKLARDYMKIYYLTDKQFKQSDFYQSMKRNIDKWDALLGTTSSKLETEFDYLRLVGKMFEKYNYYWEFVPEKDCNPDTKEKKFNKRYNKWIPVKKRESLLQKAKTSNKRDFNAWKKQLNGMKPKNYEGTNITLDCYLWDMLNNGTELREFDKTTRDYILTFPHIRIENFTPRL